MNINGEQAELFGLIWKPYQQRFRLRANDLIRIGDKLGLVIRVNECAAVVLINQSVRIFKTRFDKPVHFQPPPAIVRISANSESEIIKPQSHKPKQRKRRGRGVR
jgi:hypothetical protein